MSGPRPHPERTRPGRPGFWGVAERLFLSLGMALLTIYGAARAESWLVQTYAEWSFEQARNPANWECCASVLPPFRPGLDDGTRDSPMLARPGVPAGMNPDSPTASSPPVDGPPVPPAKVPEARPALALGRLQIPAIRLSAMVLDGDDPWSLNGAIGHIAGTAYPGEPGNLALAGHRDSFFRDLRKVAIGDTVIFTTLRGNFEYCVDEIKIVDPTCAWVLAPSSQPTLTLVTCFPFDYVGTAPRRFIVRARLLSRDDHGTEARLVESERRGNVWPGDHLPAKRRVSGTR